MSGGGGSASGAVSWPDYLMEVHKDWLNDTGGDFLNQSITVSMNNAMGNDPWIEVDVPVPASQIDEYKAAIHAFGVTLSGVDPSSDWNGFYNQSVNIIGEPEILAIDDISVGDASVADMADVDGITEAVIVADVDAFADQLDDEINTKVLPQFRRGMQDINAVVSSSFVIGEAILWAFRDRDVAKHNSAIRLSAAAENARIELAVGKSNQDKDVNIAGINLNKDITIERSNMLKDLDVGRINIDVASDYAKTYINSSVNMLQLYVQTLVWLESYTRLVVEGNRLGIVANMEYTQYAATVNEQSALWDLGIFQHGANLLASSSGGVSGTRDDKPSTAVSMIGGAVSGAAAGAQVGVAVGGTTAAASGTAAASASGASAAVAGAGTGSTAGGSMAGWYGAGIGAVLGAAAGYFGSR